MAGGLPQQVSGHQKQADGSGPSISSSMHLCFSPLLKQVPFSAFSTPSGTIHTKGEAGAHFMEVQLGWFSPRAG